jgi:hypothetical protein
MRSRWTQRTCLSAGTASSDALASVTTVARVSAGWMTLTTADRPTSATPC